MLCWLHSDNTQNDVAQPDGTDVGETNSSSGRGHAIHFQLMGFLVLLFHEIRLNSSIIEWKMGTKPRCHFPMN